VLRHEKYIGGSCEKIFKYSKRVNPRYPPSKTNQNLSMLASSSELLLSDSPAGDAISTGTERGWRTRRFFYGRGSAAAAAAAGTLSDNIVRKKKQMNLVI
jgi:hypothetical protein